MAKQTDSTTNSHSAADFELRLKAPKRVETDAGQVEYRSADEAIKADKYAEQIASPRRGFGRVKIGLSGHREF